MGFKLLSTRKLTLLNALNVVQKEVERVRSYASSYYLTTYHHDLSEYRRGMFFMREVLHNRINIELAETLANEWWNEDESALASDCMHLFHDIMVSELLENNENTRNILT